MDSNLPHWMKIEDLVLDTDYKIGIVDGQILEIEGAYKCPILDKPLYVLVKGKAFKSKDGAKNYKMKKK